LSLYFHAAHFGYDGYFYFIGEDRDSVSEDDPPDDMPLAIKRWEGSSLNYLKYTYRSRKFRFDSPLNFSSVLIDIDQEFYDIVSSQIDMEDSNEIIFAGDITGIIGIDGPIGGGNEIGGDEMLSIEEVFQNINVTFRFYADNTLRKTKTFTGPVGAFRLPRQFMERTFFYEISGYIPVSPVSIATSMDEL
jgi:hypothetical protein